MKHIEEYSTARSTQRYAMVALLLVLLAQPMRTWAEAYARLSSDLTTLTFYDNDVKTAEDYSLPTGATQPEWLTYGESVTTVVFDESFAQARPTTCYQWFFDMKNLKNLEGLRYLNTSEVRMMDGMFYGCSALESVDLSGLETDSVTSMTAMFYGCSALRSVGLSGLRTGGVTQMTAMFFGCESLEQLDLSSFDTQKVIRMDAMFTGCTSLQTLDVSSFDTRQVAEMDAMFSGCESLETLDLTSFRTSAVTSASQMFYGCTALRTIEVSAKFVMTDCGYSDEMFLGCTSLTGAVAYDATKTDATMANGDTGYLTYIKRAYVRQTDQTLTFCYDAAYEGDEYSIPTDATVPGWHANASSITKVVFSKNFAHWCPTSCYQWFADMTALSTIEEIAVLNTSEVTTMAEMYRDCQQLKEIDLASFGTAKVKDMSRMFSGCSAVERISIYDGFTVSTDCEGTEMFLGCEKLPGYDASRVDTAMAHEIHEGGYLTKTSPTAMAWVGYDATDSTLTFHCDRDRYVHDDLVVFTLPESNSSMPWEKYTSAVTRVVFDSTFADVRPLYCNHWFNQMSHLERIDGLRYLNTSETTTMQYMFSGCKLLTSLDLSTFDTKHVESMQGMFEDSDNLVSLDLSSFQTDSVTSMLKMFSGCTSLTSVDLSSFSTPSLTMMYYMFCGCASLKEVDLSGFNTSQIRSLYQMFYACTSLERVNVTGWCTDNVNDMTQMFEGCTSLKEVDLSSFNTAKVGYSMAWMFNGCSSLAHIYVSDLFTLPFTAESGTTGSTMFSGCVKLPNYDNTKTYQAMAHYKKGGYLTLRRHFTVGDTQYDVDDYESPTCYADVYFADDEVYSSAFDFSFASDHTASYSREVKNHWATLCLPFAFNADDNSTARFYSVSQYDNSNISVTALTGTIAAGTPVLAYTDRGEISVSASGAAVVAAPANATDGTIQGVFTKTEVGDNDYIIANDHFWNAGWLKKKQQADGVYVAPYRAYLTLDLSDGAKPNSISIAEGETDQIQGIDTSDATDNIFEGAELYDLQGRRLAAPQRGIVIVRKGGVSRKVLY